MMKVCCKCKDEKDLEEFGNLHSSKDGKQKYCKECSRKKDKAHYKRSAKRRKNIRVSSKESIDRNRRIAVRHLLENPCVDCGHSDPLALDFDHVRGTKSREVCYIVASGWSEENLRAEIAKCEIRCLICHRVRTAKEGGWYYSYMRLVEELKDPC